MKPAAEIFVQVFDYLPELDAFYPTPEMRELVDRLKISNWSWVEWIGRYFTLDNDYGEHCFDNWVQREAITIQAEELGLVAFSLYVVAPNDSVIGKMGHLIRQPNGSNFGRTFCEILN